jgi:hypothetical protein
VLYNYRAAEANEISLTEGQTVIILKTDDSKFQSSQYFYTGVGGWWQGKNADGKMGLFPGNYVSVLPEEKLEVRPTSPSEAYV